MSSKLRPNSSMNNLIRRKLPDCFLLDYSPISKKSNELVKFSMANKIQSAQVRNPVSI